MKRFFSFFLAAFLLAAGSANATTHIIYFGTQNGSPAFGYSNVPSSVNVGDTIIWMGPFSAHTLEAMAGGKTVIDDGGTTRTPPNGTSFTYVVPASAMGTFQFWCSLHGSLGSGMAGSFTVAAAGVDQPVAMDMMMDPAYPNPAMEQSMVHFTLNNPGRVTLRVFDATGKLVQTAIDEEMPAGFHMATIDTKQLASGNYQYVLQQGEAILHRAMIVVK